VKASVRGLLPWLPPLLWAALLFVASALPGDDLPDAGLPNIDKVVHGLVYAVLGALCFRALRRTSRLGALRAAGLAVLLATGYGAIDEAHQAFVPMRAPDARDLVADAAGSTVGAGVWLGLASRRRAGTTGDRRTSTRHKHKAQAQG
jgi:VanZ family protein